MSGLTISDIKMTRNGLKSVKRQKTVSELVVQQILDLVKNGELKPGEKLPSERHLSSILNVSRPTVREALRGLSILGVLEIQHGGGVFVTSLEAAELLEPLDFFVSLSPQNMAELFDARIEIEATVAAISASNITTQSLQYMQKLLDAQLLDIDDADNFHDMDLEFHKTILDASGNSFLSRIGKMLQILGDQARRSFQKRVEIRRQSILDHQAIMIAFHAKDPVAAGAAMRTHMTNVRNALGEVIDV